jgi:hypothetical protein
MTDTQTFGQNADFIGGADLLDKAELIGREFLITGVRFQKNSKGVEYVYVEGESRDGEEFDFNDSSTSGVKQQITTYLESRGIKVSYDRPDEIHEVNLMIPRGLRVSTYEVVSMGKPKMAKTYYLTSAGRRRQKNAEAA